MIDDAQDDRETTEAPDTTRRRLLSTAASGFALAATGLFLPASVLLLPEWLVEEAEADNHPVRRVQHRAAKRRQRRHHRLKQKRRQRQRNKNPIGATLGRGIFEFRNTALTVKNVGTDLRATASVAFFFRTKIGYDEYGTWIPATSVDLAPNASSRFAGKHFRVGALISFTRSLNLGQAFIDVRNMGLDAPKGSITKGEGLDPPSGKIGTALLQERTFGQGQEADAGISRLDPACQTNCPFPRPPATLNRFILELSIRW
jgi:hypothetical protein